MNKQEYYSGIDWEAPLSRDHMAKIYGYSLYDKQYLVKVMSEYEKHGRAGVKYVYRLYVNLEEQHRKQELKPIARELVKQIDANFERKVKEYESNKRKASGSWHGFKGFPSIQ